MDIPSTRTTGIEIKTRRPLLAEAVELVSSMRFAISLLTLIAIASMIGTVLKQNEPMPDYVNQFGPFWFGIFDKFSLYAVYSAWWFLLIMAFLVISTSLCIIRNAPKMLKDMRSWRENVREQSLRNFHHKAEWQAPLGRAALVGQTVARLADAGYKAKVVEKDHATLIAAKQGAANKWGYIFAHGAIVVICIGGLLDSEMPIRMQKWFMGKTPFAGSGVIAEIPAEHRLGLGNPTFRGNTMIPEGSSSEVAIIPQADGVLIQELPFTISLKKFHIDFYSTGMPKLFASDVDIKDHETGAVFPATIKVNEPLLYKGLAVYQSSFEDGGSKLKLTGFPMTGANSKRFNIAGEVGANTSLSADYAGDGETYSIEWSGFRPFNVENLSAGQDVRAVNKSESFNDKFAVGLDKRLGSAARNANNKDLKNVGPSVQYKLRDKTGQAREYQNYMQPVTVDGASVFLAGMRVNPSDQFSFLRIPADDGHGVTEWMRLRAALQDPALRQQAAQRYAQRAMPQDEAASLRVQLQESAAKSLGIFAGHDKEGGFLAISKFLEKIPPGEQEKAAEIFMKILNGSLWDLWQAARAKDGLEAVTADEAHGRFLQLATNALSDSFFYGAPVYLQLEDFTEVKASVLQVTRSPGKGVVYLGCLFLVIGVFSMFYIRERRLWVWVKDHENGGSDALMAMSTQRKTLDFEKEFENLKTKLPQSA
ncbi:cytochrome c biogenesis protein ResB [Janthinobacterium agaricidamnosum]|uniref:ResB-like family protein n=1 Tax=Janthinobacterium agaricidamnosum NBRC 102515 = DSM 9628 TaxID=1349767 RepID=W0VDQ9_9BURK|nr:cytochrome c biogenesis protein ResB [Janthinobacterium agaricidamnosum]CDG85513.1 resB-like family protein [Janthinobacterium agaricidamnosum NBRC 102515 = DSM 9628]